jgi:pimeloyl-ACP methyl ester carboxylesterase
LSDAGHRLIAPSRFGYLRSSSPDEASPAHQADAFAELLDAPQIHRVHVVGMSTGALSALQFAVRHPDRCRSLTVIVPAAAAVMPAQGPLPEQGPIAKAIAEYAIRSDFLWWLGMKPAPGRMVRFREAGSRTKATRDRSEIPRNSGQAAGPSPVAAASLFGRDFRSIARVGRNWLVTAA